jgi:hypothetical protein
MRKLFLFTSILLLGIVTFAQENKSSNKEILPKVHELGIGFSSTNSFSLRYQWGTDEVINRLTLISLTASNSNSNSSLGMPTNSSGIISTNPSSVNTPININGGFNFSRAKIKPINEKFGFMYGLVLGVNFAYSEAKTENIALSSPGNSNTSQYNYTSETKNASLGPLVGLLIGARYKINSSFHVYAEIAPNINYTYTKNIVTNTTSLSTPIDRNTDTNTYGLSGFNNTGALITIIYRIAN